MAKWYDPTSWSGEDWRNVGIGAGVGALTGGAGLLPMLGSAAIGGAAGYGVGALTDNLGGIFDQGTQTTTNEPWAAQQPYLLRGFEEAQNLYNQGEPLTPELSPFTQQYMQGVAGQLPISQNLINQASGTALGLAQGTDPTGQFLGRTIGGEFVGSNPYLDQMYQSGAEKLGQNYQNITLPGINQTFGGSAGAFGSGAHQALLGQSQQNLGGALGDLYTGIYAPAYEAERGRQQQAAGLLTNRQLGGLGQIPGLNTQGYYGLGQLGKAGGIQDIYNQQVAMDPWTRLQLYNQGISGQYGGTTTGPGQSPFQTALGYGSDIATIALPFALA